MKAVAIKFKNGRYYAGCNKASASTLLGAQLYKSKAAAENVIKKSVNFPYHFYESPEREVEIVEVELREV